MMPNMTKTVSFVLFLVCILGNAYGVPPVLNYVGR